MTVFQAMTRLESLGYSFRIAEDGRVGARISGAPPAEADRLFEIAAKDRAAAADYVRMRESGCTVVDDGRRMEMFDALAVGMAVKKGEAELLGKVRFDSDRMDVRLCWVPVTGEPAENLLERYRAMMEKAITQRLKRMEESPWWDLSAEEYDDFCRRFSFLSGLLNERGKR